MVCGPRRRCTSTLGRRKKSALVREIPDETMVIGTGKERLFQQDRGLGVGWGSAESHVFRAGSRLPRSALATVDPAPPRAPQTGLAPLPSGNYRTQLYDKQREGYQPATPGLGMFVEVKDPEDKVSRPRRAHPPPLCTWAPDQAGTGTSPHSFRMC